ncbi:uncharacterized protein [Palaemon carinicauda]|uniref:uncharacterized protein n=1 Tax=Palaemon carinicauda TaxID=392227 RepID=UPI0035B6508E
MIPRTSAGQGPPPPTVVPNHSSGLPTLPKVLRGDSVRILGGVWMLASLVLASVYKSNLKAMLILPNINLPFDNLQELAESNLPICTNPGSMFHQGIVNSPDNTSLGRIKHQLVEKGRRHERVECSEVGYWTGVYVAIGPLTAMSQLMHWSFSTTGRCQTYLMSEKFFKTTALGFLFPKGSSLKTKVDPVIMRLRESGILTHIYENGIINATECLKPPTLAMPASTDLRSMKIKDFYGIFMVYFIGVMMSALVFFLELSCGEGKKQLVCGHSVQSAATIQVHEVD